MRSQWGNCPMEPQVFYCSRIITVLSLDTYGDDDKQLVSPWLYLGFSILPSPFSSHHSIQSCKFPDSKLCECSRSFFVYVWMPQLKFCSYMLYPTVIIFRLHNCIWDVLGYEIQGYHSNRVLLQDQNKFSFLWIGIGFFFFGWGGTCHMTGLPGEASSCLE